MKNYKDVVIDRYNKETDDDLNKSIYSKSHPIGKYSREIIYKGLKDFIIWYSKSQGSLATKKLLDIGCGSGEILSFFASNGFSSSNLTGIDLSDIRIARAQNNYPEIRFLHSDALNFSLENEKFDLITAFDVYSHLPTKEEIFKALSNVHNHLSENGLFLWYDIYSKDHFRSMKNVDSSGFSKIQMADFVQGSGFEVLYDKTFFKLFFNRYHSIYQAKRVSPGVLRFFEFILPGSPGNIMMVMKKVSD